MAGEESRIARGEAQVCAGFEGWEKQKIFLFPAAPLPSGPEGIAMAVGIHPVGHTFALGRVWMSGEKILPGRAH